MDAVNAAAIAGRAHHQRHRVIRGLLRLRSVEHRHLVLGQSEMLYVTDHADDLARSGPADFLLLILRDAAVERDPLADGAATRPVAPGHRRADENHERRAFAIALVEAAPLEHGNPHRREVAGRDRSPLNRVRLLGRHRVRLDLHPAAIVVGAERKNVYGADLVDTREGAEPFVELVVERESVRLPHTSPSARPCRTSAPGRRQTRCRPAATATGSAASARRR